MENCSFGSAAHGPDLLKLRSTANVSKLCRFIGVADLASVRFSLPSQLLEPTPNLEYWNYLDAPNAFIAIGTSDDPVDRMLEVLRFWFTKDLKYANGKPCKPYNSCLGEFFRVCLHIVYAFDSMLLTHVLLYSVIGRPKMMPPGSTPRAPELVSLVAVPPA